jgi:hypothetical protein
MHRASSFLKLLVAAVFVAALSVAGASTAGAQTPEVCQVYATTASIGSTPASVAAGAVIQVSGSGFPANYPLVIFLNGTKIRDITTDATGAFSFPYTTTSAEAGRQLLFSTNFCAKTLTTIVEVSSTTGSNTGGGTSSGGGGTSGTGTSGTGSTSLPPTGADSADVARIGVLLLAGGAVAVAATRRRRQANTTI